MQSVNTPYDFFAADMGSAAILRSLARSGFAVVVLDAPGTPGRGRVFQDATYAIWPQTVIPNHERWIREVAASRPWMDLNRVGVYGHSWGAYMAERAMIEAPGLYKVAVGHAGPADFVDHSTYIEPFLGLPAHNPRGYAMGSNLIRVDAIQGPVLVMAAPLDVNAGFTPDMKFVDAMIKARKDVDLVLFPESSHRLNCCGKDREMYGVAIIQRYFQAHLQVDAGSPH
jgi:dipeptidyl aminopeptidase/acylaminoacyl peptidase